MKKALIISLAITLPGIVFGQNFNAHLATAKTAYSAGKLEESRFAMEQMMQELDITMGKEVLKLLPAKLENLNANTGNDEVTGTSGFVGVTIHRDYGAEGKKAEIDLITNSPMIAAINTMLSIPMIGNSSENSQKRVKIEGYRGLLQKNTDSGSQAVSYELQIPFNSTLFTFKMESADEAEVLKMAALVPISEIAKMLQ